MSCGLYFLGGRDDGGGFKVGCNLPCLQGGVKARKRNQGRAMHNFCMMPQYIQNKKCIDGAPCTVCVV